jgi:tetratricopeptide (TPR) repeat protein/TolB-like protein
MSSSPKTVVPEKLSHYRLVEQIGAGGMGVVYLARDEHLQRDVGLKVLPPGSLSDDAARKRFRKEALSLAKLNHPNIATVHEFGTDSNTDFLVTEYIAGTSLDKKLLADGAMPCELVYKLGIQLAQGLTAAHDQGVVHRDLKPANLRLTPDGRLKILDFGLAQLMPQASELSSAALTVTSATGAPVSTEHSTEVSGTIPYMAPEQLKGEKPDPRNDIWSAGAVLYEMATGKRAFPQTNPSVLINAILNEAPSTPSSLNGTVPAALEGIILRALSKDPATRYQSAQELSADLIDQSATAAPPEGRRWVGWLALGIVAGLAVAAGTYIAMRARKPSAPAAAVPGPHRRSVAVLGFKNLSGNPQKAWLSTALSEMLITELGEGDQLRTIPGESVAGMKISLALPDTDSYSKPTLHRIAQNLGSDDVVVGSYMPVGSGQLRLDMRLQDTSSGETVATVSEKGDESQIDDLVSKAGDELRGKLGIAPLSEAQTASARESLPSNPEAARLYAQGLEALRLFDAQSARNLFESAVAIEPGHAPTHSALAGALLSLGYEDKAKDQAQKALDLSAQSSREDRLVIEGRSHKLLGQWPAAIDDYRALFDFFPDNVDYGIALLGAQESGGKLADAEATLTRLRKLNVSEADAARIDLWDAEIGSVQGDVKRQQAMSQKAVTEAQEIGANLFVAEAMLVQADALEKLGQADKSVAQIQRARALYVAAGEQRGIGRTLMLEGDSEFDLGSYREARKNFDAALGAFQKIGAHRSVRGVYEGIGNVLYAEGRPSEAVEYYNKALQFDLTIHDARSLASDYGNIANALDDMGKLQDSLKMQQQALDAFNQLNDKKGATETLFDLGNVEVELGDLAPAKKYYQDALDLARAIDYKLSEPYPIEGLGDVLAAQGDEAGANKQYDQALAMAADMKNSGLAWHLRFTQAEMAVDDCNYADAEKRIREIIATLDQTNAGGAASAQAILARSLLGQGDLKGAQAAARESLALAQKSNARDALFQSQLADGRVKARSGKYAEGHKELEDGLALTQKKGYRLVEDDFRLALGEIELAQKAPGARERLTAFEADARSRGAVAAANRAQRLLETK